MKKKIFITGAAGFIGFHLAQRLACQGISVQGYDNFNAYYSPDLKWKRAEKLKSLDVSIIHGDICNKAQLEESVETYEPTHFIHLAAQAGVRYSLENPLAYVSANLEGFVNVLEICRQRTEIPLIYASSSSVYGANKKIPFKESDAVEQQISVYGVTKRTNELMAQTYHALYGIHAIGLRFFTVYGPWGRPDMAATTWRFRTC